MSYLSTLELWTRLSCLSYVNLLMPGLSQVLFFNLALWVLEYHMSQLSTLCGLDYHIYVIVTS